ncbi:hypothetical protein NIES2119_00960 [[Phormidium ambiguum] IAM M-71]|uniref:DUF4340 domain-containing protein n=1 Tax=[Phormidium ambiguum] IAM M-71 TaxID=454136 RepID=A0A1U7ITY9_9CYAN|nr:hypothetical protein [Phormidium ambiguum]OKH40909.1 hypothetical protein NIES2119_00960 [Phormidium ambiguum IAM M-71]
MKFQKSTLILMLLALMFGGIVYIWEVEGKPRREAAKLRENRVFNFEEKDVQNVVLKTKEYKLQFDRVKSQIGSNSTAAKWTVKVLENYQPTETKTLDSSTKTQDTETKIPEPQLTETPQRRRRSRRETELPEDLALAFWHLMPNGKDEVKLLAEMPANEAHIAFLLNELATGKSDRIIADPRIEDGIDKPLAIVDITLNNGKKHQLILGNLNYNNTALYAVADPPTQLTKPLDILLVPINFQNAVNRPLSEWKQQEIQPTPTPEASTEESKKESPPPKEEKPRQRRRREN